MPDFRAEIESDLSVFHRIDDPTRLGAARYLELAMLLPAYEGACRRVEHLAPVYAIETDEWDDPDDPNLAPVAAGAYYTLPPPPDAAATGPDQPVVGADIASLAAMSQHSGFPGIEYQGG